MTVLIVLLVFAFSMGLTWALSRPASRLRILDYPGERSLHDTPVPRTGGLAIGAGILAGVAAVASLEQPAPGFTWMGAGALLVALVSFLDDRFSLNPGLRLLAHGLAAASLLNAGLAPVTLQLPALQWPWPAGVSALFTLLFVVWLTNLYNFMDGMDGFAAGMAVFGFGAYALLGGLAGDALFALLNAVVAASAAGFLLFNFPPARIFMGDTGASTLGFLVAAFSLWADRDGLFPLWIGVLVFSPFVVDATITLLRRLAGREKLWQAHKSHYYQRLVQLGWGHRRTVLAEYGLMAAAAASAMVAMRLDAAGQWLIGVVWILIYGSAIRFVHAAERRGA